jgi:hypothetical protein
MRIREHTALTWARINEERDESVCVPPGTARARDSDYREATDSGDDAWKIGEARRGDSLAPG